MMEFLYYRPTLAVWVILACVALLFVVQCVYYVVVCRKAFFLRKKSAETKRLDGAVWPGVSVVIATKNEEFNLKDKLGFFLEQDYPEFEVIVVNDASADDTEYVLKAFSKLYPNLKTVNIVENVNKFKGRKFPISLGIKAAKYDYVVLSHADCQPAGFEWLKEIMSGFAGGRSVVLGYASCKQDKGLFNKIVQYDNVRTAINYIGLAFCGQPYMGDGRNLAYKKNLFFKAGGFTKHYNLTLGDDDIFISSVANSQNTKVVLSPESFVSFELKRNKGDWRKLKKERFASRRFFKFKQKFLLSLLPLSSFLFYAGVISLGFLAFPYQYIILALLLKFILQVLVYSKVCKRLGVKKIQFFAPLFEIYFFFFDAKMRIISMFSRKA